MCSHEHVERAEGAEEKKGRTERRLREPRSFGNADSRSVVHRCRRRGRRLVHEWVEQSPVARQQYGRVSNDEFFLVPREDRSDRTHHLCRTWTGSLSGEPICSSSSLSSSVRVRDAAELAAVDADRSPLDVAFRPPSSLVSGLAGPWLELSTWLSSAAAAASAIRRARNRDAAVRGTEVSELRTPLADQEDRAGWASAHVRLKRLVSNFSCLEGLYRPAKDTSAARTTPPTAPAAPAAHTSLPWIASRACSRTRPCGVCADRAGGAAGSSASTTGGGGGSTTVGSASRSRPCSTGGRKAGGGGAARAAVEAATASRVA